MAGNFAEINLPNSIFFDLINCHRCVDNNEALLKFLHCLPMAVFKLTQKVHTSEPNTGATRELKGGATREAGLKKLDSLSSQDSETLLKDLRTNLRGSDGKPKHGVLKLRNSSKEGSQMEFARMRGMDRWFSKKSAFKNTEKALVKLMVQSGFKKETAETLLERYRAKDGSIKCKDAIQLIDIVLPQEAKKGDTLQEALKAAGIEAHQDALVEKIKLPSKNNTQAENSGAYGTVFKAKDHSTPCMIKKFKEPIVIEKYKNGTLARGKGMDARYLAAGKVPGVIAANRYIISKTDTEGKETFHIVNAVGRQFKEFCKKNATAELKVVGLLMDQAKGTRMLEATSTPSQKKQIAKDFAAVLMNASSRGFVLGDIKGENAFVDKGKLTLIDTDGALKYSSDEKKKQSKPNLTVTFRHPIDASVVSQQQDLWCTGFTLLEHATGESLSEIGCKNPQIETQLQNKDSEEKYKYIEEKILNKLGYENEDKPAPGSVEDFAMLCIKQSLQGYTKVVEIKNGKPKVVVQADCKLMHARFTGEQEQEHLLDPILEHPLIGGRDAFIAQHLVKNKQSLEPVQKEKTFNRESSESEVSEESESNMLIRKNQGDIEKNQEVDQFDDIGSVDSDDSFKKYLKNYKPYNQ